MSIRKLFNLNGHEVVVAKKKGIPPDTTRKYQCTNDNCELIVDMSGPRIGKTLQKKHMEEVAKELSCPAEKQDIEEVSDKKGMWDIFKNILSHN